MYWRSFALSLVWFLSSTSMFSVTSVRSAASGLSLIMIQLLLLEFVLLDLAIATTFLGCGVDFEI
eukprot:m.316043 g.316043  ORF g.316043 m.316043 type:complete len:65 (-) comp27537_c0_seq6:2073-2267(-)